MGKSEQEKAEQTLRELREAMSEARGFVSDMRQATTELRGLYESKFKKMEKRLDDEINRQLKEIYDGFGNSLTKSINALKRTMGEMEVSIIKDQAVLTKETENIVRMTKEVKFLITNAKELNFENIQEILRESVSKDLQQIKEIEQRINKKKEEN